MITGVFVAVFAAFFPVGVLADVSNSGTLFAFLAVAIAVLVLRRTDPGRARPFRTPAVGIIAPLAAIGCLYLFFSLSKETQILFVAWAVVGLVVYFLYGYRKSHVARGLVGVPELATDAPGGPVPPMPGAPAPGDPAERA
jgi:APA family basic amino acid/polyamine antiporter